MNSYLNGDSIDKNDWLSKIYALPVEDQINTKNREFIKAIIGVDPLKSKGTLSLFD